MNKRTGKFALGTILAAVAGYFAGILSAPKSGKETREDIKKSAQNTIYETEKRLKLVHTELTKNIDEVTEKVATLADSAQKEAKSLMDAADKAKEKVRIALSSVHDGEVSDEDLQKAIEEAEKSIKYLKNYLKK